MDVNHTNSIAAVHPDGRQQKQGRDRPPGSETEKGDKNSTSGSWRDEDAVQFDHRLIDALTPEVQQMIDALNQEIEPLRRKLSCADQQLEEMRHLSARHAFIDIPSHTEMVRELEHVISHKINFSIPPVFVLISLSNGEQVRQQFGRKGREHYLAEFCQRIIANMQTTDTFGSLGGNDFALILFGKELVRAQQEMETLAGEVKKSPVHVSSNEVRVEMMFGTVDLRYEENAASAIQSGDRAVYKKIS